MGRVAEHNLYAQNYLYKVTVGHFSEVMWAMQQILFMSFDQRLAVFLLDESAKTKSLVIRLTHEQIARYMGSPREVVSRMLKYFSKGIVGCRGEQWKLQTKISFENWLWDNN